MTATPEEAKKLRSKLIGLVVAGIVIIGAYSIWRLAGTFLYNIADGTSTNVAIPTASPKAASVADAKSVTTATVTPTPTATPTPTPTDKGVQVRDRDVYLVNPFKRC